MSEALNEIHAYFGKLNTTTTAPVKQWAYGQKLIIHDPNLPNVFEAYYSNSKSRGDAKPQIGQDGEVRAPHEYFESGADIYVFLMQHEEETDGRYNKVVHIPITPAPKPVDIDPDPEESLVIGELVDAMNSAVAQCEAYVEHYPTVIDGYWYTWDETTEQFVTTGVPATGNGIALARLNSNYTLTLTFTDGTSFTTPISIRGAQGEKGDTGAVPDFSIGTVTTLPAGSAASASITGTQEKPVLNLSIPQGQDGAITNLDTTLTVAGKAADAKATGDEISDLKSDLSKLLFPLELVATYNNKILRKTGMADYNGWTVYQYKIPDNCEKIHIKTNFYGNVFIIFTDMDTDGNFSSNPYTQFPTRGYSTATTVDQDLNTNKFHYVWVPLYNASGVEASAITSLIDIVKFIGNNTIIANNTSGGLSDFNDAERNHIYSIYSGMSSIQNYPPVDNGGTLLCWSAYNQDNVQLFVSNQSAVFFRRLWGTTWRPWTQLVTADSVQSAVNTAVTNALNGYYPFNILQAFKNITCIGDSLTYSQVYKSANTSRQAYKPYPKVLADKAGATETILATAGDTAAQAWDRNNANIVQKDAQLTIIYLGTNGGLTDTIDADCVGFDYTQWADTNTGCYAKLIAKSQAEGSRVVLVKIHSSSGNLATTNMVIEKMATKFNVPVIPNTYLSGAKYHSYPDGSGTNGTHYNDFGYAVFADQVANSISQLSEEDAVKIIPI